MKPIGTLALCLSLALIFGQAAAHHAWTALYDITSDIEIEAVVSAIQWRNPHVRVSFIVDAGTANEKTYTTESNSVASLTRMNVTKESLAVGMRVRVAGYRSRTSDSDFFMNHLLLPDNREIVFLRTAEPRWPNANRIGDTERMHGGVTEDDFSKRPTSIFAVWNTVYGAKGSHHALKFTDGEFVIDYTTQISTGNCKTKDLWEVMASPYPIQLIDKGDVVVIHAEEFDTIRNVHMNVEHHDVGDQKDSLGYSSGVLRNGRLHVTTSFRGSDSPIEMHETFQLSANHSRLFYTLTLLDPESNNAPSVNSKWYEYQPGAFVQPYDCSQ